MEEKQTFWNPNVNAHVATVAQRRICEGIAQYPSTTRQLQHYLKENSACVWDAMRRSLLDIWLWWIAALLNLETAYDDKFLMPSRGGRCLLTGKHCKPKCEYNEFEKVSSDTCRRLFRIATAGKEASLFLRPDFQLYVLYTAAKKRAMSKIFQMECVSIPAFSIFVANGDLQHVRAGWKESPHLHSHAHFILSHVYLKTAILLAYAASFYIQPIATYASNEDEDDVIPPSDIPL